MPCRSRTASSSCCASSCGNAGHTVSKERLLSSVWGYHFDPRSNVVDVYVRRLRTKLGYDVITTVRGVGYKIDDD